MRCPFCAHEDTQVAETRESDEGDVVRRRRRCLHCEKRFTTYERTEIAMPAVVKKDGTRVEFDPTKLRASMALALRKRTVSVEQIDAAMERIQEKLLASGARELPSARLGELVMRELKRIDKVPMCALRPCTASSRTWTRSGSSSATSEAVAPGRGMHGGCMGDGAGALHRAVPDAPRLGTRRQRHFPTVIFIRSPSRSRP